jgi:hypothetical protein
MLRRLRLIALVTLPFVLGACGSARIHMNDEQRTSLKTLELRAVVPQEEVIVSVRPSAAFAGGAAFGVIGVLIGASIDASTVNSRVTDSQKMIGDFYLAADDVDFRAVLDAKLRTVAREVSYPVGSIEMSPVFPTQTSIAAASSSLEPQQGLWLLFSNYELSVDYRQLTTATVATIWKKDATQPIHRGILVYQSEPVGSGEADSVARWSTDGAAQYRRAVETATDNIARLAKLDLGIVEDRKNFEQASVPFNAPFGPITVSGQVLQRDNARVVLINDAGVVYSLPLDPARPQNP